MTGSLWAAAGSRVLLADSPTDVCPKPPPGLASTMNDFLGYTKYIALWAIILTFFAMLVVLTVGRIVDHRGAAKIGAIGLMSTVVVAALFGVGYVIITTITGAGCH